MRVDEAVKKRAATELQGARDLLRWLRDALDAMSANLDAAIGHTRSADDEQALHVAKYQQQHQAALGALSALRESFGDAPCELVPPPMPTAPKHPNEPPANVSLAKARPAKKERVA